MDGPIFQREHLSIQQKYPSLSHTLSLTTVQNSDIIPTDTAQLKSVEQPDTDIAVTASTYFEHQTHVPPVKTDTTHKQQSDPKNSSGYAETTENIRK